MDNSSYIEKARSTVKRNLSIDDLIRKVITFIDSSEKSENTMFEAVYDLFFLYFPEAANISQTKEAFINMTVHGVSRDEVAKTLGMSIDSMGYDLDDEDLQLLSTVVNEIHNVHILLKIAGERLEQIMLANYVNVTKVCGYELGARLISMGGGIKKLAYMPSSRIQVLGADKSRFSQSEARNPKYGIIFKHEKIENADQDLRGRSARIIASKISMAAKLDLFSKKDKSGELIADMNKELANLKKHGTFKRNR